MEELMVPSKHGNKPLFGNLATNFVHRGWWHHLSLCSSRMVTSFVKKSGIKLWASSSSVQTICICWSERRENILVKFSNSRPLAQVLELKLVVMFVSLFMLFCFCRVHKRLSDHTHNTHSITCTDYRSLPISSDLTMQAIVRANSLWSLPQPGDALELD